MRTATFLVMGALGMACAHQAAQPQQPLGEHQAALRASEAKATEPRVSPPPNEESGDPRLGTLEVAAQPGAPRPEAGAGKPSVPRPLEPEAPTVATTPPGDPIFTASAPRDAASKEEIALRERVQSTLLHDTSLSFTAKRVRVEVEKDRVTLQGEVRTAREKNEVEELVQKVSGVRRVKNQLAVINQAPRNQEYEGAPILR